MATKAKPKRAKVTRRQRNKPDFWANVKKTAACWLWIGVVGKRTGYGFFTRDGQNTTAQRVAWEISRKRSIPKGRSVTQTCGNKRCVKPDHVQLIPVDGKPRPKAKPTAKAKGKGKQPKVRKPRASSKGKVRRTPRRPKPPVVAPPPPPPAPAPSEPMEEAP